MAASQGSANVNDEEWRKLKEEQSVDTSKKCWQ